MANQDALDILRRGATIWNEWRRTDPNLRPDLSGADLRLPNLRDAHLSNADLRSANLRGVDLSGTYLGGANLSEADLCGANLSEAKLDQAHFDEADLTGANLSKATLTYADLGSPYLKDTDLRDAVLRGADFSRIHDLSQANFSGADLGGTDLSEKHLSGVDLSGANLAGSYLREAELNGANLYRANLFGAYLSWADLSGTNLREANLFGAYLRAADLTGADLSHSDLRKANFSWTDIRALNIPRSAPPRYAGRNGANLSRANLSGANLSGADLSEADLSQAKLRDVNLSWANLSKADLSEADLTGCFIYATSVWDVTLVGTAQSNLIITDPGSPNDPVITVDNLEVAQFVYLLLNNARVRHVIDTITSKAVLILGRFSNERKNVLEAIKDELRKNDYLPLLFDFEPPRNRDLTETVGILARMSRFIIADMTDPRSIPQELYSIVPFLPNVPVLPLLEAGQKEYAMFETFKAYPWVLPIYRYEESSSLLLSFREKVINPAEERVRRIRERNS